VIAADDLIAAPPPAHPPAPPRVAAAIAYAIDGDLRFISHHDEMHMIARAVTRAAWPLSYSEGFNPKPRLSIPQPRRTGTASLAQLAIVELARPCDGAELAASLERVFPHAARLLGVTAPTRRKPPHAVGMTFEAQLDPAEVRELGRRIETFFSSTSAIVERRVDPAAPPRAVDIRPYVLELTAQPTGLRVVLTFDGQKTARPSEVLAALGILGERQESLVRIVEIAWDEAPQALARDSMKETRNHLVQEETRDPGGEPAQSQEG
jgi:radical SAM-linked protein